MTVSDTPVGGTHGALHRPLYPQGQRAHALEAAEAPSCTKTERPFVLIATIVASSMAFIDGTVAMIALPVIQDRLSASFSEAQWVINSYALFLGTLILLGGAAGDRFGHRRLFSVGVNLFALASVFCAVAPTVEFLIGARALQGVGAALMVPQSLALIAVHYPKEERGRAIGLWAAASAVATAMGPVLGGFMIDLFDWRSIFWINFPLSIAVLFLVHRFIPEETELTPRGTAPDWVGAALGLMAIGGLSTSLTMSAEMEVTSSVTQYVALAGVIALALFCWQERRHPDPLVPLSLFSERVFVAANVMTVLLYGALGVVLFLIPFDLIERRHMSASHVGLLMLPFGLIIGVASRFVGAWADRHGPRTPLSLGSLCVAVASAMLAATSDHFWAGVFGPIVLMAVGMGLVVSPLTTAVMNAAADAHAGAAAGVNNAASRIAGLFGIVCAGALTQYVFVHELTVVGLGATSFWGADVRMGALPPPDAAAWTVAEFAFRRAYGAGMLLAAGLALMAALISFFGLPSRTEAATPPMGKTGDHALP